MVSVIKRARKLTTKVKSSKRDQARDSIDLTQLLAVRLGPGAAILPPEVTRIHMEFAVKQEKGHTGARVFWRTCLRRLKYHNPAIPMTVSRSKDQKVPALLTIHFTPPAAASESKPAISSTTSSQNSTGPVATSTLAAPTERTEVVIMKQRTESQILQKVMKLTKAKIVQATDEELEQFRDLREYRERAEADAKRQNAYLAKIKREKDIMDRARAMVDI